MVDLPHLSAGGDSGSSPSRDLFAEFGVSRPSSSNSSEGGPLMGESIPNPPTLMVVDSDDLVNSSEDRSPVGIGGNSEMSEVFKAAHSLTSKDRLEAVEERKKNKVLLDFILSLGFSLDQLNDFKSKGSLPQKNTVCEELPAAGAKSPPLASGSGAGVPSWSSVVVGGVSTPEKKVSLQYFPPVETDGKLTIIPPVSVLKKGLSQWSNSLTGHFLHSKLPFSVVEPFVQKHWGSLGLTKVLLHEKGYYVFKFTTPADRANILALGPWYIANKLLLLKPWREGLASAQENCTKAPVWVKFHGVPYSYWTPEGLSFIASGVGKPLFLDKSTEKLIPMNFARVCVEIGLHSPLPKSLSVTIINEDEDSQAVVDVQVEYQSIPPICLSCQTFGHSRLKCPKANYQWVPKTSFSKAPDPPLPFTLPAVAAEPQPVASNPLPDASENPEIVLSLPLASPNPFAALEALDLPSPASCSSHLNNRLFCKLKEVDEKERKERKDNFASGRESSKDILLTQPPVINADPVLVPSATMSINSKELKSKAMEDVVGSPSAKRRNKGKGRKSPKQPLPPPLMVNICSYNIRGLNKKPKQSSVKDFLASNNISFVGLIETRVKAHNASSVSSFICRNWNWAFNYEHHGNGRIWIGWDPNIWDINILSKSTQSISCSAKFIANNSSVCISFVYGLHTPAARRALWSDLYSFAVSLPSPWAILGDFNEIQNPSEVDGGSFSWGIGNDDLKSCLESISVEDLRASGAHLTWWDSHISNPTYKKLDRILVNDSWLATISQSTAHFGPRDLSDHCPAILLSGLVLPRIPKPFQFFNYMLELDDFKVTLAQAWDCQVPGDPIVVLSQKLRRAKIAITDLNRRVGNLSSNVDIARQNLHSIQLQLNDRPRDNLLLAYHKDSSDLLWNALAREESLLRQKSRILWLKEGDSSSRFFFNKIKSRWNSNKILSIQSEDGNMVHGHEEVKQVAVDYYFSLLGSPPSTDYVGLNDLGHIFSKSISRDQYLELDKEVSLDEIWKTLKSLKRNKSPGPDGFNVNFFLINWEIVGSDFLLAVQSFFRSGCALRGTNSTAIALIPKSPNPTTMGDFRPISCCNTFYKCVAKILANRLKKVLPDIISPTQTAFVPGRRISDNVLLAQELLRNYHRNSGPPRCTLKIDLQKAFDSVRWDFLLDVLYKLKFPPKFIFWIRACITTTLFSIKVNGALCGYFKGARGLRQGDPLSPYLFVLVMEVLSLIIANKIEHLPFKFHWRTKKSQITNLCFADDLMIFCNGDRESVRTISFCLSLFSSLSGLVPNISKCQCFLANVNSVEASGILSDLQFTRGSTPAKFLGVPLISSKLSAHDCKPLIDKITARVTSWTNNFLSFSGRIQLVRSVLFAIQAYWSSVFILPASVSKSLKSILTRFLWRGSSLLKHGVKVAWNKLALPYSEGGLNWKHIDDWNSASILLHLWNVLNRKSTSLWARWIKDTVIKDKSFWSLPTPSDCSWIWRKVLKLRVCAANFIKYVIGNGRNTDLWFDPWLTSNPLALSDLDPLITNSGLGHKAKVADILSDYGWQLPESNHTLVIEFRESFDLTKFYDLSKEDQILWGAEENVSISTIWQSIRKREQEVNWWTIVWNKCLVPRYSFYLWLAHLKGFRTKDVLIRFGIQVDDICPLCKVHPENLSHLFFHCPYSYHVMHVVMRFCGWKGASRDWKSITQSIIHLNCTSLRKSILSLGLSAIVYHVWKERNARLHSQASLSASSLARLIFHSITCRLHSFNKFQKCRHRQGYSHLGIRSVG